MKKVFVLSFVTFCFGFTGLVLWAGSASADPPGCAPVANNLATCQGNLNVCEDDLNACEAQPPAPVPQTGQTTCWDSSGTMIDCAGTGQDGDIQAGVVPPDPRFTDNGDGTITDNLTHLVWLKDANCLSGRRTWQQALDFANGLYDGCTNCGGTNNDCGLTDGSAEGDWRLPNRNELTSLLDLENFNPALPAGHPFMNFQSDDYWSSTTIANTPEAWSVYFVSGDVDYINKSFNFGFVLPVRGGS
jgi:hypothetical protein